MGNLGYFRDNRFKEAVKTQEFTEKLKDCDLGKHKFSGWFCVPSGLGRECKFCHAVETAKIVYGEVMINPPLDEDGFLDKKKLKELLKIKS